MLKNIFIQVLIFAPDAVQFEEIFFSCNLVVICQIFLVLLVVLVHKKVIIFVLVVVLINRNSTTYRSAK